MATQKVARSMRGASHPLMGTGVFNRNVVDHVRLGEMGSYGLPLRNAKNVERVRKQRRVGCPEHGAPQGDASDTAA